MINLYETYPEALHLVQELEAAGIPYQDITFLTRNGRPDEIDAIEEIKKTVILTPKKGEKPAPVMEKVPEKVDVAPNLKGKFFDTLELYDIKGLGEVIAAGWLVEPHKSQGEGPHDTSDEAGLVQSITEIGLDEGMARTFVEGVRRGGTLVGVLQSSAALEGAQRIMQEEHSPLDPHMRGQHYWTKAWKEGDNKDSSDLKRLLAVLIPTLK